MNTIKMSIIICLGFFVLLQESLSQVVFPSGSTTSPENNGFFGGNNVTVAIQTNICICVNAGRCSSASGVPPSDGSGVIDIRIVNTPSGTPTGSVTPVTNVVSSGINPIVTSQSFCSFNLELCCPATPYSCGIRYSPFPSAPIPTGAQTPFGSQPWHVVILTSSNAYVGSGVLIDHMHVLTVAHKVNSFIANGVLLKARMGDWDAWSRNEPIPHQEFNVARVFVHPQYSSSSLVNSIAILRLSSAVPLGQVPTITTGCLAGSSISNMRCWVAGWGSAAFNAVPTNPIQTHVDVPIVDQAMCQIKLRTTKLGTGFILDTQSFMCAGGESGKDACTGDGGSPLMCPIGGKWFVVGLVAWGIGCGTNDVPGVYINVTNYVGWIQSTTNTI